MQEKKTTFNSSPAFRSLDQMLGVGNARHARSRQTLYQAIKQAILFGEILPGESLGEEKLAKSFKTSRTPIRESLAILEHEGFITPGPARGMQVCQVDHDAFLKFCEANALVEPFLAKTAAERKTAANLFALEENLQQTEKLLREKNLKATLARHREFHHLIGIAAKNPLLAEFVFRNEERIDFYLISYSKNINLDQLRASSKEHQAIYDAIVAGTPSQAEKAMVLHEKAVQARFSKFFP